MSKIGTIGTLSKELPGERLTQTNQHTIQELATNKEACPLTD